jgi:predicted transcriptional regulator
MAISDRNTQFIDVVEHRIDFLENLKAEPAEKRALAAETEYSRSTIDRGLRDLESLELVNYCDGRYETNLCGVIAVTEYRKFAERMATIRRLQPFLKWIQPEAFDLEIEWLTEADLYTPQPGDPYAMINQHVARLKEMETVQALLPYTGQHATEAAYKNITEQGSEADMIVNSYIAEMFQTDPRYAEFIEELAEIDRFRIFEYDGMFPYAVSVFNHETVQIMVDEDEEPRAMIETDHEDVRAWAEQRIERYKAQADRLI